MAASKGWLHSTGGYYFSRHRNGSGDVAIKRVRNGETQEVINVSADEWVKIVAHVSNQGGTKFQIARARELHG